MNYLDDYFEKKSQKSDHEDHQNKSTSQGLDYRLENIYNFQIISHPISKIDNYLSHSKKRIHSLNRLKFEHDFFAVANRIVYTTKVRRRKS